MTFLKTHHTEIRKGNRRILLRGVNLGGWLMMEGYILHSPNVAEQVFKRRFLRALGKAALRDFEKAFRDNFIREEDFRRIARLGFNCVRVPFNYRLIERAPYRYDARGVAYLDKVLRWGKKHRLWVILDLHAAYGCQNHDWHSDSTGPARLWHQKGCQARTVALWKFLADRFKDHEWLAGYDLLNEAVTGDACLLNRFYRRLIAAIREVDRNHIIFVEGNHWAMDLDCLERFDDDNIALSVHYYQPLEFTFNLIPQLRYPLRSQKGVFDRRTMARMLGRYVRQARRQDRPILVGEFGVNSRQGFYGEDRWLKDLLHVFAREGFHWTYWTYKAVKNAVFPDGIWSSRDNPPWVNRQGCRWGWDNYASHWPKSRGKIIRSWRTEAFGENPEIVAALKQYL